MSEPRLADWLGRRQHREELLTEAHVEGLNALLDRDGGVPLGLQWLLCAERVRQSRLGPDGHPQRGDFLPPVELPRRMWAAGEIRFHGAAPAGVRVSRNSTVAAIEEKSGRSGALVFVKVDHAFAADGTPWLDERHTIVYREAAGVAAPATAEGALDPGDWQWRRDITTDTVQLFRYSALTFNGHRIHYDQRYATEVEGYPGLVVHGPLMATWLMNFADGLDDERTLGAFSFRVKAPVFVGETITLLARAAGDNTLELKVADSEGRQIIDARADLVAGL